MKHIINYLGSLLAVVLIGAAFTACSSNDDKGSANVGLGIKTFFPTKVVTNQPMTINGSGFDAATEVVFPGGVKVTDFEIVSDDMIRVNAPSGIAAEGGKLIVRTAAEEAESKMLLTVGKTKVTGFDKQPGETATGGDLITIYGTDLEFIKNIELLDADGNPQLIDQKDFYRKGTNNLVFQVPLKNIFKGNFVGHIYTYDGQEFDLPELAYQPGGGHFEMKEFIIWEGNFRADWGTGQPIPYAKFAAIDGFGVGDLVRVYVSFDDDGGQLQFLTGSWNNDQDFPDLNLADGKTIKPADLTDGYFEVTVTEKNYPVFTSGDMWGGPNCIMFQGNNKYTLTKVVALHEVWVSDDSGPVADIVKTIWDTETVFDGWSASILIGPEQFADLQEGDLIRIYIKDKGDDYNPIFKHAEDWSNWDELQSIKKDGDGYFESTVTAAVIEELQTKGLRFQGLGFTITKVDLTMYGRPADGDDGITSETTVFETETVFDGWGSTIVVDPTNFEKAKVGNTVRVYIKDKGDDYNPIFKHVSDWGNWDEFQGSKKDADGYFEAPIPDGALDELQKDGLRFQGLGFTITKVTILP